MAPLFLVFQEIQSWQQQHVGVLTYMQVEWWYNAVADRLVFAAWVAQADVELTEWLLLTTSLIILPCNSGLLLEVR